MAKKREEGALLRVVVLCLKTEEEVSVAADDLFWYVRSDDCDLCGSHDRAQLSFNCPACDQFHNIEVYAS